MVFWKDCIAYYMASQDLNWISISITGQMELKVCWRVYLTGGEIKM